MKKTWVGGQDRAQMTSPATRHPHCFPVAFRIEQPPPELGEEKLQSGGLGGGSGEEAQRQPWSPIRFGCLRPKLTDQSISGRKNSSDRRESGKSQ